ncbi:MAG: O-antigen ligase family protein [Clostridia bacterium]|nr:O-antigen ligase family protein [Clostridia bacterium]
MQKISNCLSQSLSTQSYWLKTFFYGKFYPIIVGIVALISYVSYFPYLALTVFVLFACTLLLLYRDLTPFLILPMGVVIMFRNFSDAAHPYCIVLYGLVAVCLIAHFILYPPKHVSGKLFLPFLAITIALFLGGVGSRYVTEYKNGLFFAFMTGPFLAFVYYLFSAYILPPKEFDLRKYFSYIIIVLAVIISFEILLHQFLFKLNLPVELKCDIGWANINAAATLLLFSIPICWYKITKSNYSCLYFILLFILYLGVIVSNSHGCIGITIAMTPFLAIFSVVKCNSLKKRTLTIIYCSMLLAITLGVSLAIILTNGTIVNEVLQNFFNDSGRLELYDEALWLFKDFPIFGVGLGYVNADATLTTDALHAYNFHSTLFHVCATMGIVGLIAYVYYFIQRFRILGAKNTSFNLFSLTAFVMYTLYGLMDTCEFMIMPQMLIVTILIVIVEKTNKRDYEKSPSLLY